MEQCDVAACLLFAWEGEGKGKAFLIPSRDVADQAGLQVQLSLGSSPTTTLSSSATNAGSCSQLGSPTSLPEAFTAPSSVGEGSSGGSPSDGVSSALAPGPGGTAPSPQSAAASAQLSTKCGLCHDTFTIPKVGYGLVGLRCWRWDCQSGCIDTGAVE